eukprot:TRINITY_DN28284_c0_g1_i1.p1 TRINITY_DN28284_c0_g1~~TRINITY_DN28284_c0_g1_i1.p1  ORF type:complete len:297 (+),score=55.34 TRINITY_DN28284_c0_g1_i1:41-892(+)
MSVDTKATIEEANADFESFRLVDAKRKYKGLIKSGLRDGHVFYRISLLYSSGRYTVAYNPTKFRRYLNLALELLPIKAQQGDREAQADLAYIYDLGLGGRIDKPAAVKLYQAAADAGLSRAQYNLGNLYAKGDGVKKDEKLAFQYLRMAADQKDYEAAFLVAKMARKIGDYSNCIKYIVYSTESGTKDYISWCSKVFKGEGHKNPDISVHLLCYANDYIAHAWPRNIINLDKECWRMFNEVALALRERGLLQDLYVTIGRYFIRLWKSPHFLHLIALPPDPTL